MGKGIINEMKMKVLRKRICTVQQYNRIDFRIEWKDIQNVCICINLVWCNRKTHTIHLFLARASFYSQSDCFFHTKTQQQNKKICFYFINVTIDMNEIIIKKMKKKNEEKKSRKNWYFRDVFKHYLRRWKWNARIFNEPKVSFISI